MSKTRRQFLTRASLGVAAVGAGCSRKAQVPGELPPGAPPAFGTAPDVGPDVSPATFAQAEKLVQFDLTAPERDQAAGNWRKTMAPLYEGRRGPRKYALDAATAPATLWNPASIAHRPSRDEVRFIRSRGEPLPVPAKDDDIAFATVTQLSRWIEARKLTSERLT